MALLFLPSQHIQSMFFRTDCLLASNGNMCKFINLSASRESNIQCLLPAVGQSTTPQAVSAMLGLGSVSTRP